MPTPLGDFHHPDKLLDRNGFDKNYKKVLDEVKGGLPPFEACRLVFGITIQTFNTWIRWTEDDIEAGFDETESNLIKLILGLAKEDAKIHKKLSTTAIDVAVNDKNTNMLQFLLKTRYGYTEKTKSEVDVSIDDTPVAFNIVDMKPNGEEED